jgi:aquaporin Z
MATKKAVSTTRKAPARKAAAVAKTVKRSVKTAPATATKNTFVGHVQQTVRSVALWRSLGAEFIGTMLLAGVIIAGQGQPIFVLFALVGIVLLIGAISGAHVNPAVTIGALVTRRIGWLRALGYLIAQGLGAAAAYAMLTAFLGGAAQPSAEAQLYGQVAPTLFAAADFAAVAGKEWFVFFSELVGTAILGFAIANATRESQDRVAAAFTAGLGIFIALMIAVTAASYVAATGIINPAVAIALQAFDWGNFWTFAVYLIAPVIGAVLGFIIYDLLRGRETAGRR